MLTGGPFLLAHLRLAKRVIQRGDELGTMSAQGIACARIDERFDHPLVAEAEIHAVAQLDQRTVGRVATARDDRGDRAFTDVAHGAESETNAGVADDRELVTRLVD